MVARKAISLLIHSTKTIIYDFHTDQTGQPEVIVPITSNIPIMASTEAAGNGRQPLSPHKVIKCVEY
jgi:hypothetical protein